MSPLASPLKFAGALAALLTLGACQTVTNTVQSATQGAKSLFEDEADPEINAVALVLARQADEDPEDVMEQPDTAALVDGTAACDPTKTIPPGDFSADYRTLYERGYGTWPMPEVEGYLTGLLARIAACAPGEPIPAEIAIVPAASPNAHAYENGLIAVNIGLLMAEPPEDALAFVLAHEYGHLLLDHHARAEASDRRAELASIVTEAAFLGDDVLRQTGNEPALRDKLKNPALTNKTMDLVFTYAWGRVDEHEADMLGKHLMAMAGFNPLRGPTEFLINILKDYPSLQERMAALAEDKQTIFASIAEGAAEGAATGAATGGEAGLEAGVEDGVEDVLGGLADDVGQTIIEGFQRTHPAPEERQALLLEYRHIHGIRDTFLQRRQIDLDSQFPLPDWQSVLGGAETQAIFAAFENANTVADALTAGGSLAEIETAGYSEESLLDAARKGVSGPAPWLEHNAYGRLAFSALRRMQGRADLAKVGYTRFALADPEQAPLRVYEQLMETQILEGEIAEAEATLRQAAAVYGAENVNLYMMRIKLAGAKGEDPGPLLASCRLSGEPPIAAACRYWAWDNTQSAESGLPLLSGS